MRLELPKEVRSKKQHQKCASALFKVPGALCNYFGKLS
ncbi:hypothetical protein LINPERHAP2_LOCUS1272, partial [Linum perenne]